MRALLGFKKNLILSAIAVLGLIAQPMYGIISSQVAHAASYGDVVVRSNSINGWNSGSVSGGSTSFVNDSTAPYGHGALEFTTSNSNNARAQRTKSISPNLKLSDLHSLSYSTKYISGPVHAGVGIQITINNLSGVSSSKSTTLVYEPYWNGTVDTNGSWQNWNTMLGGKFWSTTTVGGFTNGAGGPPFYTLSSVLSQNPDAKITSLKLNTGTYNPSWVVRADGVNFNGTVYDFEPILNPTVTGENFNTHSDTDYRGINVGFRINQDFGTVSNVKVELYNDDGILVTNSSNQALLDLINNDNQLQLSTPFIVTPGTYQEEYWNLGSRSWGINDKPTKAIVTVTGTNGTKSTTLTPLVEPNGWSFENLVTPGVPKNLKSTAPQTNKDITNSYTNIDLVKNSWDAVSGAVAYNYEFGKPAGLGIYKRTTNVTSVQGVFHDGNGPEGQYRFRVQAVNSVGLTSEWSDWSNVTLDTTKPTLTVKVGNGANDGSKTKDAGFYSQISFKLFDKNSNLKEAELNGNLYNRTGQWNDLNWVNINKSHLVEGNNTATIRDKAGNQNTFEFVYDSHKPLTSISSATQNSHNTIEVEGEVSDSNLRHYYCYLTTDQDVTIDGHTFSPGQEVRLSNNDSSSRNPACETTWAGGRTLIDGVLGGFNIPNVPSGNYTVNLVAVDKADNTSETASYPVVIDHTAPELTIASIVRNSDGTHTISGTTDDDNSPVKVQISGDVSGPYGATPDSGAWSVTISTILLSGTYGVTASSTDALGNTGTATPNPYSLTVPNAQNGGSTGPQNGGPAQAGGAPTITTGPAPLALAAAAPAGAPAPAPVAAPADGDGAVLGAQDNNDGDNNNDGQVKGESTKKEVEMANASSCGKILGLCWYWWIPPILLIVAVIWRSAVRSVSDQSSSSK